MQVSAHEKMQPVEKEKLRAEVEDTASGDAIINPTLSLESVRDFVRYALCLTISHHC